MSLFPLSFVSNLKELIDGRTFLNAFSKTKSIVLRSRYEHRVIAKHRLMILNLALYFTWSRYVMYYQGSVNEIGPPPSQMGGYIKYIRLGYITSSGKAEWTPI